MGMSEISIAVDGMGIWKIRLVELMRLENFECQLEMTRARYAHKHTSHYSSVRMK